MSRILIISLLFFLSGCGPQPALYSHPETMSLYYIYAMEAGIIDTYVPIANEPDKPQHEDAESPIGDKLLLSPHLIAGYTYVEVCKEEERMPMIALTFDDGPSQYTGLILDLLEEYGGLATFFVLGSKVEDYQSTIRRAADLGNEVASHSWSHPRLTQLSPEAIARELMDTSNAIRSVTGYTPPIMRPPYGQTSERVLKVAENLGYAVVNWNLDPRDWQYRDADRIYSTIMREAKDGSVIVLHDIHATTASAMERVIPRLIEEGYRLVTVSELLTYFYGELVPGKIYGKQYKED